MHWGGVCEREITRSASCNQQKKSETVGQETCNVTADSFPSSSPDERTDEQTKQVVPPRAVRLVTSCLFVFVTGSHLLSSRALNGDSRLRSWVSRPPRHVCFFTNIQRERLMLMHQSLIVRYMSFSKIDMSQPR